MLRTLVIAVISRLLLPPANSEIPVNAPAPTGENPFRAALNNTLKRFHRRIRKIVNYTVPIY